MRTHPLIAFAPPPPPPLLLFLLLPHPSALAFALSPARRYFKAKRVRTIIRLNKKYYTAARFEKHGIKVVDMYYRDGAVPSMEILQKFILTCETATSAIGVHCKAGLGRTGTCLGAYIMKHYGFTAAEAIGWIRICRPGSIIGPQQHFLESVQAQMWADGDEWRRRRVAASTTSVGDVSVSAEQLAAQLCALAVAETSGAASSVARPLVKAVALEPVSFCVYRDDISCESCSQFESLLPLHGATRTIMWICCRRDQCAIVLMLMFTSTSLMGPQRLCSSPTGATKPRGSSLRAADRLGANGGWREATRDRV